MGKVVTQEWLQNLTMMQQTVLLTAIRGPDTIDKYHPVKYLLRWYRRCILLNAMDSEVLENPYDTRGGSFTGPSVLNFQNDTHSGSFIAKLPPDEAPHSKDKWQYAMLAIEDAYLRRIDSIPHHFHMHFMQASEIIGYKHPKWDIAAYWLRFYNRCVNDMHLNPESEQALDRRLGDNRETWLAASDPATTA